MNIIIIIRRKRVSTCRHNPADPQTGAGRECVRPLLLGSCATPRVASGSPERDASPQKAPDTGRDSERERNRRLQLLPTLSPKPRTPPAPNANLANAHAAGGGSHSPHYKAVIEPTLPTRDGGGEGGGGDGVERIGPALPTKSRN